MSKLTAAALLLTFCTHSFASDKTDAKWSELLKKYKFDPSTQSYCYTNERGELEGKNVDLRIRLASVSKLVTSLWAVDQLGPDYRFETKLYIKNGHLHIKGSYDPFFGNEKAYYLLSQLNNLGYNSFDKITFDKNLIIFPNAQFHTNEHPIIGPKSVASNLSIYFNTSKWSTIYKEEYKRIASLTKRLPEEVRINQDVDFSVKEIVYTDINPLENDAEARVLTLSSPALKDYLKETNVKSNNYSSQTLFKFLGGEKKLQEYLATNHKLNDDKIHLYTGSGLPAVINGVRKDNYATCEVMTELVNALKESSEKQDSSLSDIMAVPGADQGTFRRRLNGDETKNSFMAKTGTLMHTSTLSGALSTKSGLSFFGVFNQTSDIVSAKTVQDAMVHTLIADLGGVSRFPYNPETFYTIDDREKMKKFGMEEEAFLPFELPLQ